jgi:CBS domain-containing protein
MLGAIFLVTSGILMGGIAEIQGDPLRLVSGFSPASTLLLWLGSVNLLVALFNLIPGFPLDGGRILRSIIWSVTKDLRKATRLASSVGQAIAWLFILSGIAMVFGARMPFFGIGVLNGVWLAFIGWFLNSAASGSYQQVIIQELLEDVPVARLMRSDIVTVRPDLSVSDFIYHLILETDERSFPVTQGDTVLGMVSLEDARKLPREAWERTSVSEIMTPAQQLAIVAPNEVASTALEKLARRDVRLMPVVENGHLVGLLRRRDIAKWIQLHAGFEPV